MHSSTQHTSWFWVVLVVLAVLLFLSLFGSGRSYVSTSSDRIPSASYTASVSNAFSTSSSTYVSGGAIVLADGRVCDRALYTSTATCVAPQR